MPGSPGTVSETVDDPISEWAVAIANLDRAHQSVLAEVNAAGVPAPWFAVLAHLLRAPEQRLPMGEIARELSMTTGGFTKLADRMAQAGLIDRRGASQDRRMVYAALTDHGREQAEQARAVFDEAVRGRVLAAIAPEEVHTLAAIGRRLAAAAEGAAAPRSTPPPETEAFAMTTSPPDGQDRRRPRDEFRPGGSHEHR